MYAYINFHCTFDTLLSEKESNLYTLSAFHRPSDNICSSFQAVNNFHLISVVAKHRRSQNRIRTCIFSDNSFISKFIQLTVLAFTISPPDFRSFPYPLLLTLPVRCYCRMLTPFEELIIHCTRYGNRTRDSSVKGTWLNRLSNRASFSFDGLIRIVCFN